MRSNERKLYVQESEIRPNRYVVIAITVLTCVMVVVLVLNEVGIFLVQKVNMRYAIAAGIICLELPLLLTATQSRLRNPKSKYLLLTCVTLAMFIISVMLYFHTILACIVPMLLAAQYPSRRICRCGLAGSLVCAVFAPICSLALGLWGNDFLLYLLKRGLGYDLTVAAAAEMPMLKRIIDSLMYLSLPNALILLGLYPMLRSVSNHAEQRLRDELQVLHMSESDQLTGLLNRWCFDRRLKEPVPEGSSVTCVYVDANDLHRINNDYGHDAGDRLLCSVSGAMQDVFGDEQVYRVGGDEFVAVMPGIGIREAGELVSRVRRQVEADGYSVSVGL